MKKIIFTLPILGILFCQNLPFVHSAEIDTLSNREILKTNNEQAETKEEVRCLNLSTSNSLPIDTLRNVNKIHAPIFTTVSDYIIILTLLVTVSIGTFAIFIGMNIYSSNKNLNEAKEELLKLKSDYGKLKEEKNSIIDNIKKDGEEIFKKHIVDFDTRYTIKEIRALLSKDKPNKEDVYRNLSTIVEHVSVSNAYIFQKCKEFFPDDKDIAGLEIMALSNIARVPVSAQRISSTNSRKLSIFAKLFTKLFRGKNHG
jgi:cell division protein FtsB